MNRLPRLTRLIVTAVSLDLLTFTILRVFFWKAFYNPNDPFPEDILLKSLYLGFKFDLRLALLLHLPLLLSCIKRLNMFDTIRGRRLCVGYLVFMNFAASLFYLTDFGHYAYLQVRVNATVLRYLYNPDISFRMIWETYPVVWGTLGLAAFLFLYGYTIRRLILRISKDTVISATKWKRVSTAILTILFFMGGIYGKLSFYPLRWSDAYFTIHPFASALALNPVLFFFDTVKNRQEAYDLEAVKKHYNRMSRYLGIQQPDQEKISFLRTINKTGTVSTRPNIVIVILESFAFYRTGIFGNPLQPTPNFDAIAGDSLFFRRFYTPTGGTARSVFALVTGIPDVEGHDTSTRNPLIVKQHTIINSFKDYEKFYFLGGSATWANIRGLLSHNIPGLHIYEEGSFNSERVDVWGISDLHLFEEANRILRQTQDQPFFAIIQTSGNHRPYTIPKDNRGFKLLDIKDKEVNKHGFSSKDEFNSFRFMDHSIGFFIDTARKEKYFENTIFLFFGDHGFAGSAPHIPKAEDQLTLTHFHVPFLIYAPKFIPQGKVYDKVAGELDVLPTIAAITSTPYKNTTLGRDLFDTSLDSERYAFFIQDQSTLPQIGLLSEDYYFVMNADGTSRTLHLYHSDTPRKDVRNSYPQKAAEMEQLCRAIYETSRYMIYHNELRTED